MILNGKAKEDFLDWKVNNKNLSTIEILDFKHLSTTSQNALIIEWFDSVGIYILITDYDGVVFWSEIQSLGYSFLAETRKEATEKAIIKANEIYNESTHTNIGLV